MFPYSIRSEFTDGQSLEFIPTVVRPLGLSELTALSLQPNASITLQCLAKDPKINGEVVMGTAKMDGRLAFNEPVTIYSLVPNGGWLPVPFVSPQHFLLDRNVVANFRKLRQHQNFSDKRAHQFWTRFFEQGTALFNPLPYALEGNARRIPEFDEFVQAFEQGVMDVEEAFPRSGVVRYSPVHYRLAYAQLQAIHANTRREIEFLCEISLLLVAPTSDARLRSVADRILETAHRHKVDRQSLAVLLTLSCLFEDPQSSTKSIGTKILKPRQTYEAGDAYNAICDLRHIELAATGHAWVTSGRFALCTSDKAVASLWCALGIRDIVGTTTGTEYTFDFSPELFPRLNEAAIGEIASLLAA
jgi:hypothetical protein